MPWEYLKEFVGFTVSAFVDGVTDPDQAMWAEEEVHGDSRVGFQVR